MATVKQLPKHKLKKRLHGESTIAKIAPTLGNQLHPVKVPIIHRKAPLYSIRGQPIPLHDYLNFKQMSSNEILLNIENHENFSRSELIGALIELSKRDKKHEHNWLEHPWTAPCIAKLKEMQSILNARDLIQT
jgi:hypothetical protein